MENDKPVLKTYIGFEDMLPFELGQDLIFVIVVMNVRIPHSLGISPTVELL